MKQRGKASHNSIIIIIIIIPADKLLQFYLKIIDHIVCVFYVCVNKIIKID